MTRLLTEALDGGWGLGGHTNTNDMLAAAARTQVGLPRCPAIQGSGATRLRANSASCWQPKSMWLMEEP